jgi:hypothetical protein
MLCWQRCFVEWMTVRERSCVLGLILSVISGCDAGRDQTESLAGGSPGVRQMTPEAPPDPAGKAVLDELGMSDLPPPKNLRSKVAASGKEGKTSKAATSKQAAYSRPERWIQPDDLPYEFWEIQYLGNQPVGYSHTRVGPSAVGSAGIYRLDAEVFKQVSFQGQQRDQHLQVMTIEEVDGSLRTVEAKLKQGPMETSIEGSVVLGKLRLQVTQAGKAIGKEIDWGDDFGGPFADIQTLRGQPLKPGESRAFSWLDPISGDMLKLEFQAKDYVSTPLLDGLQHRLLEVVARASIEERGMESTLWLNEAGEPLKSYHPSTDIRSFRCERSLAESVRDAAACEGLSQRSVTLAGVIEDVEEVPSLIFQLANTHSDSRWTIPSRTNQSVRMLTPLSTQVTIHAMQERTGLPPGVTPEPKADESYLLPSPILQADDRLVKKLANDFVQDATADISKLEKLRRGVFRWIKNKQDFSPRIASAAEVARSQAGDSTEHAMLLAAVVRALKVPSRVAWGVMYNGSSESPAMVFHCWTEVYLRDHWVNVDATRESDRTNATYLKLVDSACDDFNPYASMLAVLQAIPHLQISVNPVGAKP